MGADFIAGFDWITPMEMMLLDFINGPAHHFHIPRDAGWPGQEIATMLKAQGISTWGMFAQGDVIVFSLRRAQAGYAQRLMLENGIPITAGLIAGGSFGSSKARARRGWMGKLLGV